MSYTTYLAHHGIKGQKWGVRRTPEQLGHINGGTPKIYKLHNYKGKLYFISKEEMDGQTLNPRVPDNFLTRNGFEDGTTKRVCFSHDPGKCLTAMSQNVSGQSFNVYEPAEKHDIYKPNNVVVPDADITGEMWIKEPVKLKKVGTIKCTGDTGEAGLPYKYGNNTAELYDWNYEWTASKDMSHSALSHHGIKGQKWGVRRFQNPDGSLTSDGRHRQRLRRRIISRDRTNPEINDLVRAMSDEDKARIGLDKGQEYTNHDESVNIAHRSVLRRGKKIVAFCDAFMAEADLGQYGKNPLYVAIGTSAEQQNRGKGYATIVAKQMQKWFDSQDEFDVVVWSARKDNAASRKIAEKLNFKYIPESASDTWVDYAYSKKREVSHSVIVNDDIYSYRSYLAHHGIKGQKWGVRRFQNYDGTRIKNGSSSNLSEGARLVRDISSKYNPVFKQTLFEKLRNRTHIDKKAEAQRDAAISKVKELINDSDDDIALDLIKKYKKDLNEYEDQHSKFEALAGIAYSHRGSFSKDTSGMTDDEAQELKDMDVSWYMFDDGNQGKFNSVDYYLVSKGKNPNEYAKRIENDRENAINDIKKKVKNVLGDSKDFEDPKEYDKVLDSVSKTLFYDAEDTMSTGTDWSTLYYNVAGGHTKYSDDDIKMMKDEISKYSKEATKYAREWDSDFSHSDLSISEQLMAAPSYTTYLAHHGIKGQKWGVRRFQKADGSLTAAGAKRYGIKGAMSAGRKVGAGLVKAARGGIQKAKEVKARKAAEKLERQKKVWAKTRLGLTMNADKFSIEELREANNRLDERDRAARGLAEQVKRGVGYFQAIRDVTGAIKDTKDYIEDISGEKGKKAKAADELKYQRELEKEKRTYERDMVRDQLKANQEYEYKREKDKLDRESKEKIEKMKAKAKKKKESGGSDSDPEPDESPKKKSSRENTTEFEEVYWNSSKKDREFMETVFPKEVDEAKERKKRRNKARREVDEAIRRMGFFGHSDISTYGAYLEHHGIKGQKSNNQEMGGVMSISVLTASDISAYDVYLAHHGIKGQKWGVRRFQNPDGTLTAKGLKRQAKRFTRELNRNDKRMASSRAASMMQRRKLDKNSQQIEKATFKGNTKKVAKLEAKRAKIEAKKAKYDAKTNVINDRQKAIGEACKNLNLDIASKTVSRSGRTRAGKVGVIALGLMTGIYSYKSVNGTKYKVRSDPKARRNGTVRDYSHGENRLSTGIGINRGRTYRGGIYGTSRWND